VAAIRVSVGLVPLVRQPLGILRGGFVVLFVRRVTGGWEVWRSLFFVCRECLAGAGSIVIRSSSSPAIPSALASVTQSS
jgi:hypothetical protein